MKVFDLYREIPVLHCKGLCEQSCGVILLQTSERLAIEASGPIPEKRLDQGFACPLLVNGRCSRYAARPLICRLWGAVKSRRMRCPHGCRPKRWLSDAEGQALIDRALEMEPEMRGLHADVDEIVRRDGPRFDADSELRQRIIDLSQRGVR